MITFEQHHEGEFEVVSNNGARTVVGHILRYPPCRIFEFVGVPNVLSASDLAVISLKLDQLNRETERKG